VKQVSGRELVELLRRRGWSVDRIRGSHYVMVKPGRTEIITVPVHKNMPLKPGLLLAILRVAGIDKAEC